MASRTPKPGSGSSGRLGPGRTLRSLGGWKTLAPSLLVLLVGLGLSATAYFLLLARAHARQRSAFDAEATFVVGNLRSAFERPLEILEATATFFEASQEVSRGEFARFVKPALERHPGVRALEWIPIVPAAERERFELAARADGLAGYQFRERGPDGSMRQAGARAEYFPIYFMEPGHPLVLGFDCASEPIRKATAELARASGAAVASERVHLLDDPPNVSSVVVFQPVFDASGPPSQNRVRGFACEVFRVKAVADHAIEESLRRGIQVALLDPDAPAEKRLLFESRPALTTEPSRGLRLATDLRYADRNWQLLLTTGAGYHAEFESPAWLALLGGAGSSLLFAATLWAVRVVSGLRRHVRRAQKLGQYELLEKLGEGGVGVVYKARHALMRRPTAIKLLAEETSDPRRLARFEREVQLTSELTHPNTIAIYDYGRTPDGVFYYAMEYIDGINLEELVATDGAQPAARVAHLLKQVCQALAEAHAVGLIHRDIKPANLMLCQRGGIPDFIKVMDFGLVKDLGATGGRDGASGTHSSTLAIVGTPLYLAPEAISDPAKVDARADLYALGAVAYFLITGGPVFTGSTVVEICGHHLHSTPERPSRHPGSDVPASLESVVLRCLAKRPEDRFVSATALHAALAAMPDVPAWSDDIARAWWAERARRRLPRDDG